MSNRYDLRKITVRDLKERLVELEQVELLHDEDVVLIGVVSTIHPGKASPNGHAYDF